MKLRIFLFEVFLIINLGLFSQESDNMKSSRINNKIESKATSLLKTFESAQPYLTIRIFPSELFDDSTKQNLVYREDYTDLISVLTLNMDEALKLVASTDIQNWNKSVDEIFSVAKMLTKENVNNVEFEAYDVGNDTKYFVAFDEGNMFINSILYFPDLLKKFDENKEGILIGIPVRNVCSVMPIKLTKNLGDELNKYFNFLYQVYINEENPTTLNIYLLKDNEFYTITPLFDDEGDFQRLLVPSVLIEER